MFRDKILPLYRDATDEQLKILSYGVFGHVGRFNKLFFPDEYEEFKKQVQPIEYEGYTKRRVEKYVSNKRNAGAYSLSEVIETVQKVAVGAQK